MIQYHPSYPAVVSLSQLELMIHLGVTKEERTSPQTVLVSFSLYFKKAPRGCFDDMLEQDTCYHRISDMMKNYCNGKEFHLIEYLGYELYKQIRASLNEGIKIAICIEKSNAPVPGLKGPASFSYHDLDE